MSSLRRLALVFVLVLGSVALSACASMPKSAPDNAGYQANDPLEPVNRVVFDVNDFLDRLLIGPLAGLYDAMIPPEVREHVADILSNMKEPVIFANNILQGRFHSAGVTAERFAINTTIGIGGTFDWANDWKLYQQTGDFGQTLYSWGLGSGPYLVLPLLGPSNLRDAIGLGVDSFASPWQYLARDGSSETYWDYQYVSTGVDGINKRAENAEGLKALRQGSLDFYAQMRSVYNQYRAKQLGIAPSYDNSAFDDYGQETGPAHQAHHKHRKSEKPATVQPQTPSLPAPL
ncbi:MAG TPA: VacJ family lipoprotein [Alphaproteobacteria bacterium]|nr:VacJ family lipoprotein [Alphaproteobacteria bacterium]